MQTGGTTLREKFGTPLSARWDCAYRALECRNETLQKPMDHRTNPARSTNRSSVMRILHHLAGFFPARHQAVQVFMKHALSDRMHMARKGA